MSAATKHQRANELVSIIEERKAELIKLKRATVVEVSNDRRGYLAYEIPPHSRETDTLGELVEVRMYDRLGKDERVNAAIMFVEGMIDASQEELEKLQAEYESLFSPEPCLT